MPAGFPYMNSITNLPVIFNRIKEAGSPPRFTHEFLTSSLGFASSNDRSIISVLRQLAFLTSDGTPTDRYNAFRGHDGGKALASGLREGWSDLFLADERANDKSPSQLKSLFKSVTGKSESVAEKMATTFKALCDLADWSRPAQQAPVELPTGAEMPPSQRNDEDATARTPLSLHQDFHIHLPATSDVAVYRAIFRALKEELV